jgi:hypothetical protein
MPILKGGKSVPAAPYSNEAELQNVLQRSPNLLRDEDSKEPAIEFVYRQLNLLGDAGLLDLLLVDSSGLPIIVEVKLKENDESRRKVVGQVIDYLSSLTDLTVHELNNRVNGELEKALRRLTKDADPPENEARDAEGGDDSDEDASDQRFDQAWEAVDTNLRAGRAKLVVALDEAPPQLEKIFRFLARSSHLNVQLVTVKKYSSTGCGDIFVPRTVVNPATEGSTISPPPGPHPEFEAVINAYRELFAAGDDVCIPGHAAQFRFVFPRGPWPRGIRYVFKRYSATHIWVWLVNTSIMNPWGSLETPLHPFVGQPVAGGGTLLWHANGQFERLKADIPLTEPLDESAKTVAEAMHDLISKTRGVVTHHLGNLPIPPSYPCGGQ